MTYFSILALLIVPPLVALAALTARKIRPGDRLPYIAILALVVMALVYTTPWDNYLVATGVWRYDRSLVTGLTLGWVPIEEYTFFVVQTLLTGFWTVYLLSGSSFTAEDARNAEALHEPGTHSVLGGKKISAALHLQAVVVVGAVWLLAVVLWLSGWRPGTYLALILAWALLPIMLQSAYGADILWSYRRLLAAAVLPPTAYLWLVDFLAIRSGTWTLDPAQTLGINLGGVLAVEEMVFFFMTDVLICFGIVLVLADAGQRRSRAIRAWLIPN